MLVRTHWAARSSCLRGTEVFPLLVTPFARLDERIEREIRRMRARYELSLDEFRGLYVSDEQVDRLVRLDGSDAPALELGAGTPDPVQLCATDPRWRHLIAEFS